MAVRVFIADDHPVIREGLIRVLSAKRRFEVVGQAGDGRSTLEGILQLKPDVAVLDISMPEMSGLEIVKRVRQEKVPTRFVILTLYRDEAYFNEALDCGVMGYILKENAVSELLRCLEAVAQGRFFISSDISDYLVRREEQVRNLHQTHPGLQKLTPMERRILKLIAENKTSREIARELFISHRTVQNHRANICSKLGLKGHNKLLQFALENKSLL